MKVKIIKCCRDGWWYRKMVGETLEVEVHDDLNYEYPVRPGNTGLISKEDCIVVEQ